LTIFTRNWRFKVLAIFVALSTWSVVAYANNPPDSQSVNGLVVEHGPPPTGLVLLKEPDTVSVTISSLRDRLSAFKRESLHASIDLSGAHSGHNLLRVKVDNSDKNISVLGAEPASLDLELDQLVSVERKVEVRTRGTPASCCQLHDVTANPAMVTLRGPQSQLQNAIAFVTVDVDGKQAQVAETDTVQVETSDHKSLSQVAVSPSQVAATVPIDLTKVQRTVPLHTDFTGALPAGYRITRIDYTPVVVEIEGDPGSASGIAALSTDPISLTGATADIIQNVNLRPPKGVTVLTKGNFNIHVFIEKDTRVQPTPSPSTAP
jgi:YbbR domain-containing protein